MRWYGEFPAHLGEWKFVHLKRGNLVRQAISLALATHSGAWSADVPQINRKRDVAYDREELTNAIKEIERINRR